MRKQEGGARLYRAQFRRLLELDERIRSGSYPNAFSFAREWEVSRKTVVRDIEFLRDGFGAPIEYDQHRRGYFYRDPTWSIRDVELTEGELLQVLLAERMATHYRGTPLAKALETIFDKLRELLPDKITVDPRYFGTQVSFHGHYARRVSEEVWSSIFRALMGKRVLKFRYKVPEWRTGQTREVEPLHLACIADEWYLIAYDRGVQDLRHFAVARVQRVVDESGERFEPRAFDPERYFANRFGRFVGKDGEHVEVAIKFRKDVAAWTTEREWHARQKVRKHADGTLTLSFPSPSLDEVKRWVLQWGSAAEVIEPAELRQQVKDELEEMKRNYAD